MRENFAIQKQRAALERLTFPVNPQLFRVPEPCHAAILDCRTIHERLLARERRTSTLFNSSKNFASSSQEWRLDIPGNTKRPRVKWDENRRTRQHLYHSSKVEMDCKVILVELILTVVWLIDYPRLPISELHLGKFSWLYGSSKLKSQLQDWSMFEISRSSSRNALHHRSWNSKVNWEELMTSRSIFGAKRFSHTTICSMRRLRLHWRDFSTRRYISEKEQVSKSRARKNTIDSKEGDKLRTWSTSISVQLELMKP